MRVVTVIGASPCRVWKLQFPSDSSTVSGSYSLSTPLSLNYWKNAGHASGFVIPLEFLLISLPLAAWLQWNVPAVVPTKFKERSWRSTKTRCFRPGRVAEERRNGLWTTCNPPASPGWTTWHCPSPSSRVPAREPVLCGAAHPAPSKPSVCGPLSHYSRGATSPW